MNVHERKENSVQKKVRESNDFILSPLNLYYFQLKQIIELVDIILPPTPSFNNILTECC